MHTVLGKQWRKQEIAFRAQEVFLEYYGKSFQKNSQSEHKNMLAVVHSTVLKPTIPIFNP